jgi:hypothetical protein
VQCFGKKKTATGTLLPGPRAPCIVYRVSQKANMSQRSPTARYTSKPGPVTTIILNRYV